MPLSSLRCIFPSYPAHRFSLFYHFQPFFPSASLQKPRFSEPDMRVFSLFSLWVPLFFSYSLFSSALMADDGRKTPPQSTITVGNGSNATSDKSAPPPLSSLPRPLLSPPPFPIPQNRVNPTPFRPSIAVIVGVLTTMFSITFLLLLYAKHCKRGQVAGAYSGNPNSAGPTSGAARKNSGIDRAVIESLPIFRFASLRGQKEGLECAVCLTRFEPMEVLRLLPKCKHAFHVECVDTWLDAHSTCPLCRYRVDPEDVLLIEEPKLIENSNGKEEDSRCSAAEEQRRKSFREEVLPTQSETRNSNDSVMVESGGGFRRVSGRHSSAGERTSHFLQILVQRPSESGNSSSSSSSLWASRRSLDSACSRRKREMVNVGCFERSGGRKDGLLLSDEEKGGNDRENFMRRFEHRIILSRDGGGSSGGGADDGYHRRWSDLRPSDLLFLHSELIISNSGRYSFKQQRQQQRKREGLGMRVTEEQEQDKIYGSGRSVINSRCMSEITGLNRFSNRTGGAGET